MAETNNLKKLFKENWGFCLFVLLMFASRSTFADWYKVPTGSMLPTIVEGDRILVNKMAYRVELPFTDISLFETGQPQRGDIVVFNSAKADTRMVKRVIGLPGDRVAMTNNRLTINGKPLRYDEAALPFGFTEQLGDKHHLVQFSPVSQAADNFSEVTVPAEHYLVLGDNRNNSADSRYYGFVPAAELQGKATRVIVSLNPDKYYLPRS